MSGTETSIEAKPVLASDIGVTGAKRIAAETLSLVYIAIIAVVASTTGASYVLFPELGALSHDVFTRPKGTWARAPLLLAITPALTGAIGIAITRNAPYGVFSVLAVVCASIAALLMLRSPVAPSISAGLLPLVLGVQSWWYPPAILFGTSLLALLSIAWSRYCDGKPLPEKSHVAVEDVLEHSPTNYRRVVPLIVFVAIAAWAAEMTGLRFILFPPLVVIGFEMFGHPDICPWAARPLFLPIACFLTAAGGLILLKLIGANPLTAALSMGWGIAVLRAFDLHVPPALAVALLPMVMDNPGYAYPFSVGIGTLAMTLWFLGWKAWGGMLLLAE